MTFDLEVIMGDLTDTERKIVEFFIKQGGTAREIASSLNVSERTVYKALYKYRKIAREKGIDPSAFYLRGTIQVPARSSNSSPVIQPDHIELLKKELLKELAEILEKSVHEAVLSAFEELSLASSATLRRSSPMRTPQLNSEEPDITIYRRLAENLERLNYNIEKLSIKLENLNGGQLTQKISYLQYSTGDNNHGNNEMLPSFVQNNPWIEVLQKKTKSTSSLR
ncbi:MAG: helix-turn-helix transcriptional regulator [Infirmifilum sp.]|jgi:hypothetical protein|uniref:Uncharacterized protein n=2 Tax=Infirmifilum uzonense TaxID=1550241 RepID=A0A0F7FHV3_9CREN|nr:HTH domain-containing protein [Infirmifilum uzonense]AKG38920.1 hypothetical protein MA03_06190 [Infirmifilum uzonense]